MLSGPLRELERVLVAVRSGQFLPDSTRSGRWLQHSPGTAGSKSWQLVDKPAPPGSPSSSSSSSSDSSEAASDSDDGDEEKVVGAAHFVELVLGKAFLSVVENKGSRLLHILNGNSVRLLCGRSYGKNFRAVSDLSVAPVFPPAVDRFCSPGGSASAAPRGKRLCLCLCACGRVRLALSKLCEACSLMQLPHGHFGLRSGFLFSHPPIP